MLKSPNKYCLSGHIMCLVSSNISGICVGCDEAGKGGFLCYNKQGESFFPVSSIYQCLIRSFQHLCKKLIFFLNLNKLTVHFKITVEGGRWFLLNNSIYLALLLSS